MSSRHAFSDQTWCDGTRRSPPPHCCVKQNRLAASCVPKRKYEAGQ